MSAPDHEHWGDAAGAYLLGALADDERHGFEAHLVSCPTCREEVDELLVAVDALPEAAPPLAPPPELKARIMAVVEREAALLAAAGPEADRPPEAARPRPRRGGSRFAWPRLAGVVAAGALAVGVLVGVALDGGEDGRTVTATVDRTLAPGARAEIEIHDGRATLVARGLPDPPEGRVYQVWVKRPGSEPEPTPALFSPTRDGSASTLVPGSFDGVEQVLVTHEPLGGSRAPTTDPVLTAITAS